jgi:hypothetical protein
MTTATVYRLGPDGSDDRLGVDCPICRQAVRVDLHAARRLSLRCFGGCDEAAVAARLDVGGVAAAAARMGGAR